MHRLQTDAEKIALRKEVSMVFQQYNLFPHKTALENVMMAPIHVLKEDQTEVRERALALLTKVGLAEKHDAYPGELSGGQQQRVAIARSLAMRPEVMLFDEVTAALDPETVKEVLNTIRELARRGHDLHPRHARDALRARDRRRGALHRRRHDRRIGAARRSSSIIRARNARARSCRRSCSASRRVKRYSIFSLLGNALAGRDDWPLAWRSPAPKKHYDAVIIGGGGHGLATAYYLAKEHGIRNVAVLEKGWLGGGNTGRNTTIVRSNYHLDANAHFYEYSLKLWEGLSQALNFNVMYSARGVLNLVHTPADMDAAMRRGNAMRLNGIDAQFLSRDEIARADPQPRLLANGALSDPRRAAAAARRHRAPRCGRVGLRACRRRARRRHHCSNARSPAFASSAAP